MQAAAVVRDIPLQWLHREALEGHKGALERGEALPVGSIRYLRSAMHLAGISEPRNFSYPSCLQDYLHRRIESRRAGEVQGRAFIKPQTTKAFTGCVFDTLANPEDLDAHDRLQYQAFLSLAADEPVWVCEPVEWLNEARYYALNGELLGMGLYGEYPDEAPQPDPEIVQEMLSRMHREPGAPIAFALDVGVLKSGQTALVECTDAWAVGYYKGSLSAFDYLRFLSVRWAELLESSASLYSSRTYNEEK